MSQETIQLAYPFEFEGKKIDKVPYRRLKGRDIRQISQEVALSGHGQNQQAAGSDFTLHAVGKCVELPIEALDEMDAEDLLPLMERVGNFLSPTTS